MDDTEADASWKCEPSDHLAAETDNDTVPNFEFHTVKEEPDWEFPLENEEESEDGCSSSVDDSPVPAHLNYSEPYVEVKLEPDEEGGESGLASVCERFQCASCFVSFPTMVDLTKHIIGVCFKTLIPASAPPKIRSRRQKQTVTLHCDQCGRTFTKRNNLKSHMLIHSGVRVHACAECGKSFRQKSDLTKHMLVHTGAKNYKCRTCEKPCQTISSRNQHERFHTGVRNFKCGQCGQAFFTGAHLKRHMVVHNRRRLCFKIYESAESEKAITADRDIPELTDPLCLD